MGSKSGGFSSGVTSSVEGAAIDPHLPVIIGVGQFLNRVDQGADPLEPYRLMSEAVRIAAADTGKAAVFNNVELTAAVPTFTWRYRDPAALVNEELGITGARTWYATVGGNTPQMLLNRICRTISEGQLDLAVLCGAEAGRSRGTARREGTQLTWTKQADDVSPDWIDESPYLMGHEADAARGLVMPLQIYPLFENSLWHASGRSYSQHLRFVGELWSGFSKIAANNPYAWRRDVLTPDQIVTPTEQNRLLGSPYTKRMVANPDVDMASAAIICSAAKARELGIASDRWVFVHSGSDAKDHSLSERIDFTSSPAIRAAGNMALRLAGTDVDEVTHLDVYSCYPSAVEIAIDALGISPDRQLTVYGGLAFAGGPWNNPVGHAIASMVDVLRGDAGATGLITANGGNIDKHAFGVYSTAPPVAGYRYSTPQGELESTPKVTPTVEHSGEASIEAWTVMHDRNGEPEQAHAACRTHDGLRTWAITRDDRAMKEMVDTDMTGRTVVIDGHGNFEIL